MLTGHCECHRVQLVADATISDYSHCHCSQCRRLHGAAFATFAGVPVASISYRSGRDEIRNYASSADHNRLFCGHCGSALMVLIEEEPDMAYLSMSILDGNPPRPDAYHIFVGSKAPWHDITDNAPQHDTWPPE